MSESTDVFVIGGGPAGLAAAIAARQRGLRVIVADGGRLPLDKTCGEGLMPDAVETLRQLGISLGVHNASPFHGIRFLREGITASADFPLGGLGWAIRRTTLHNLMCERALEAGVDLRWQTPVTGISQSTVHLGKYEVQARWIVGADGGNSRVRRWAGLDTCRQRSSRVAFRKHFRAPPWTNYVEVYWSRRGQVYVSSISPEHVCVTSISRELDLRVDRALSEFPDLQARLANVQPSSIEKGAITGNCRLKHVFRKNVALIGDASGTVDPITGEGLCMAFRQAFLLADCLVEGDLEQYEREHRRLSLRPMLMSRLLLLLDRRPRLERRIFQVFRERPAIFEKLLALHVGQASPARLAFGGLSLGWGLLTV